MCQPVSLVPKMIIQAPERITACVQAAEALDGGSRFEHEAWHRPTGSPNPGHGVTAVLEGGTLLEKVYPCCTYSHQSQGSFLLLSSRAELLSLRCRDAAQMLRRALPFRRLL